MDKIKPLMIKSCNINISGGEALMNPECIDILSYLSEMGVGTLNIVSNGTLIDEGIAEKLSKIKNLTVQISLDGASRLVHEQIRGKNTYEKTLTGIKNCLKYNLEVSLSPIVTENLYNEMEEYFLLARRLGVHAVFLQPVNEVGRAKKNNLKRVDEATVFKKFVEIYKKYDDMGEMVPGSLDVQHFTSIKLLEKCLYCGSGISSLAIQPDGKCYPCPNTIIPGMEICNAITDEVDKYGLSHQFLRKMRGISVNKNLPDKCKMCDVKLFCGGGCRGVAIKHTGNIYGMSPECASSKRRLIEMIWTMAKEPDLFSYEVVRKQKYNERLELEARELLKKNIKFTQVIPE